MVQLGKPQAMWERVEDIDDGRAIRTTQYALRKDGSLVRSATTEYAPDAEHAEGNTVTEDWAVVSEADATPNLEEMNKRMGASGYTPTEGKVPEEPPASVERVEA